MKRALLLMLVAFVASCSPLRKSSSAVTEDNLIVTRKYVGDFIEYRTTKGRTLSGSRPHLKVSSARFPHTVKSAILKPATGYISEGCFTAPELFQVTGFIFLRMMQL